jgi:hypothetical protein
MPPILTQYPLNYLKIEVTRREGDNVYGSRNPINEKKKKYHIKLGEEECYAGRT